MKPLLLVVLFGALLSASGQTKQSKTDGPDCSGGWPTNMTFVNMKNAGLVSNRDFDFTKTTTARIASQKIAKDLWHQIYTVRFVKTSGQVVEAIAIHDASMVECSMTGVEVYVVSKHLKSD
jgi:hypothetical protein